MKYYLSLSRLASPYRRECYYHIEFNESKEIRIYDNSTEKYVFFDVYDIITNKLAARIKLKDFSIVQGSLLETEIESLKKFLSSTFDEEKEMMMIDLIGCFWECSNAKVDFSLALNDLTIGFICRTWLTDNVNNYIKDKDAVCLNNSYDLDGVIVYLFCKDLKEPVVHILNYDKSVELIYDFIEYKIIKIIGDESRKEEIKSMINKTLDLFNKKYNVIGTNYTIYERLLETYRGNLNN